MSEDAVKGAEEEVQKITDKHVEQIDKLLAQQRERYHDCITLIISGFK